MQERSEAQKTRHELVNYTPRSPHPKSRCGTCAHFIRPDRCETVKKPIVAAGWCERYERKK